MITAEVWRSVLSANSLLVRFRGGLPSSPDSSSESSFGFSEVLAKRPLSCPAIFGHGSGGVNLLAAAAAATFFSM